MRLDLKLKEISLWQVPWALCQQREGGKSADQAEQRAIQSTCCGSLYMEKPHKSSLKCMFFRTYPVTGRQDSMTYKLSIQGYRGVCACWVMQSRIQNLKTQRTREKGRRDRREELCDFWCASGIERSFAYAPAPWHFLYFLPLPQGQGSLRPTLSAADDLLHGLHFAGAGHARLFQFAPFAALEGLFHVVHRGDARERRGAVPSPPLPGLVRRDRRRCRHRLDRRCGNRFRGRRSR